MAEEIEKCAKDGLPESASRMKAGVRQSICGNGHNWATGSVIEAQKKAQAARDQEMNRPDRYMVDYDIYRRLYGRP